MTERTGKLLTWLRIAWTMFFTVVIVLLVVLWVRSYWRADLLSRRDAPIFVTLLGSNSGSVYLANAIDSARSKVPPHGWRYKSVDAFDPLPTFRRIVGGHGGTAMAVPSWALVGVAAIIASAPWLPVKRFSLRTLLIAITLVAVGMGFVVWAVRS